MNRKTRHVVGYILIALFCIASIVISLLLFGWENTLVAFGLSLLIGLLLCMGFLLITS